jgi:WD40 repeat protein
MQIFSAHSASVSYGVFANNGKNVVTASEDGSVRGF